jgi:hypothetical protein
MGHFSSTPAPAIFANELRSKYNFWLGREDSNLRMAESKSAALPLGYAPPELAFAPARRLDAPVAT